MIDVFFQAVANVLGDPLTIFLVFLGTGIGIVFGAIPGLTATVAIAMMLPVTFNMTPTTGISTLVALYIGGISGGLISAILLNMPGTPSSIATCFDGRPLALKGQAGKAIGVGVVFSFLGTMFGIAAMVFISPWLASLTIKFGPWEYFAVTLFSLTLIASLSGKNIVKGVLTAVLGMMFATVGLAPVDGVERFTFGNVDLSSGFTMLSVLVGLYAISEIMKTAGIMQNDEDLTAAEYHIKGFGFTLPEFISQIGNAVRSALIGLGIGILPGIGGGTSNLLAYSVAKNQSKYPEKFGTGIIDGVVASETANNATIGGAMIPLLTLGIPGDTVTAMLLGGFVLHGIQPGPLLFESHGDVVYGVFVAMILSSVFMLLWAFGAMRLFIKVLKVPKNYLYPIIIVLCTLGAYAVNNRIFDALAMVAFGVVGFVLERLKYPLPPFILGFVLSNTFELNLRRGLQVDHGNFLGLFSHPIATVFFVIAILSLLFSIKRLYSMKKS
ncbi:tripartite tricarboxylate transporter permease [Acidaminococcus timonensis]|jgi:putative tricarboxylic transport membrane protein|uniref:tripartite tricarboxylate transporter permease n=1 Tax=Acidaminococcus timonensis TaxID=1871002 RepID=UPI003A5C5822